MITVADWERPNLLLLALVVAGTALLPWWLAMLVAVGLAVVHFNSDHGAASPPPAPATP